MYTLRRIGAWKSLPASSAPVQNTVMSGPLLLLVGAAANPAAATAESWLLLGGYTGVEGAGAAALDSAELLRVSNPASHAFSSAWCATNLTTTPLPLDGATINIVDTFQYYDRFDGNGGDTVASQGGRADFSGAHNSAQVGVRLAGKVAA